MACRQPHVAIIVTSLHLLHLLHLLLVLFSKGTGAGVVMGAAAGKACGMVAVETPLDDLGDIADTSIQAEEGGTWHGDVVHAAEEASGHDEALVGIHTSWVLGDKIEYDKDEIQMR
mmetsp:Transcript_28853/g.43567  ORF Transcript_28853/g.43567 Transcript_28853/m.43567 type:complete len:116 (-) Transcript_28853:751-1098(-)